jgi:hypothetical protein
MNGKLGRNCQAQLSDQGTAASPELAAHQGGRGLRQRQRQQRQRRRKVDECTNE